MAKEFHEIVMDHVGGTKFYRIFMFSREDGRAIVITNYGPVGKSGHISVKRFLGLRSAEEEINKTVTAKQKRGYLLLSKKVENLDYPSSIAISAIQHIEKIRSHGFSIREFLAGSVDLVATSIVEKPYDKVPTIKEVEKPLEKPLDGWGDW
jgi:predicted DNA-binding WGR domain protein